MKKTAVILILALLAGLMVFQASAVEGHTDHCLCCDTVEGHSCQSVAWEPLPEGTADFGLLESGNYYLTENVTVTGTTNISQGKNIALCLNGCSITTTGERCFGLITESTLTITDCSHSGGAWGGTVTGGTAAYGQILYSAFDSVVNIYGGNFTRQEDGFARGGGLFCVAQDGGSKTDPGDRAVMNIYNGSIRGGKAGNGGNIYVMHCSQVNMYGGQISDGVAEYIEWTESGSTKSYVGKGGNVCIYSSASFNLYGGSIYGGTAAQGSKDVTAAGCGGNIFAAGTLNVYGGQIYDGLAAHDPTTKNSGEEWSNKTTGRGGNVYIADSTGLLNMSGGQIYDGLAYGLGGGNIYADGGSFLMSGGMIWGGIANADQDSKNSSNLVNAYDVAGGSIYINGRFTMTGGSIGIDDQGNPAGGTGYPSGAESGNLHLNGSTNSYTISGGVIAYGNIIGLNADGSYIYGGISKGGNLGGFGAIHITGTAMIRDGYASSYGGNWALYNNGSCTLSGGVISGGRAVKGGNIVVDGNTAATHILTITGGTVTGGTATTSGGNIAINYASKGVRITGGTVTDGTAETGGNFYIQGTLDFDWSTTITGGSPGDVMVMSGGSFIAQYDTPALALAALQDGQYLRLTGDVDGAVFTGSTVTDLAGNSVTNAVLEGTPQFIDSATDGYDSSKAGTVTVTSGTVQPYCTVSKAFAGVDRLYITAETDGGYTFQRYYMAINKLTLKPSTLGMGYKATFKCSEELKSQLSTATAFGYQLWLTEDNKLLRGFSADQFNGTKELTLRIDNFLDSGLSDTENEQRANVKVYACPYIRLADGTVIEGVTVSYSFREMLELANKSYDSYSAAQQSALQSLSGEFSGSMISWDIDHIHHADGSVWQTGFAAALKSSSYKLPSGSYVLTEDVDIGSNTIRIESGRTVNICLNGYTLTSSARLFRNYGNLTLCDCHSGTAEGTFQSTNTFDSDDTDIGEFAPLMYCYANSVTNLYGGNLKAVNPISYAGVIAVSHDNSDTTLPAAVFNMYGGTIYGNTVTGGSAANKTAAGGAVSLWNGGSFNLYGGTVTGGSATHGGIFNITSNSTLNIYGGTITGGTAVSSANSGSRGGNIYNIGTVNLYGGTVTGGTATEGAGGNIYSTGTLNLYGGTVTGGTATVLVDENGDDVYSTGVSGGIFVTQGEVFASGTPVIDGNTGSDLYIGLSSNADLTGLQTGARIGLASDYTTAVSGDISVKQYLFCNQSGKNICTANGKVLIASKQPASFSAVSEFSVGYSTVNITTTQAGLTMSPWGNPNGRKTDGSVGYELYATAVAISDEQNNTVLMITLDLQSINDAAAEYMSSQISAATGIPASQIYLSATHTHNCPSLVVGNASYYNLVTDALVQVSVSAMADRAPATMETGSFDTVGMNWTRNYYYYLNDDTSTEPIYFGDQFGQTPQNGETIYRVREGDTTMHMLAFNREDKQPVLVVNWRAHPHRSGGMWKYSSDADVIGATREYIHSNTNYLFAYFQGAAGNMNTVSRISGQTYSDRTAAGIAKYGAELARQIIELGLPELSAAETGLIQTSSIVYAGAVNHSDEIYYENALALYNYFKENPELMDTYQEQIDKAKEYEGVYSVYHAQQIIARHNLSATKNISMNVFSIGNSVGFCTAPGEIWDQVSEELEGLSPFETTFFMGYCDGGVGYIPYGVAGNYPSYEYYSCVFEQDGVITQMMAYYLEFLEEQYNNAQ